MTNDQTVTQALEPCPMCGGRAELIDLGDPQDDSYVHCTRRSCGLQQIARYTPAAAITAWNTRTAHSGDLAPGLERAALWHDARCKGPDVFEQELHEVSAKALRHLAANPDATDMQALDAAHSGEGRSNGAGRWMPIETAPKDGSEIIAVCATAYTPTAFETWWQDGWTHYSRPDEKWHGGVGKWFPTHWMPKPVFPALSAPQGEVERLRAAMKQAEIHIDCASFRKAQDILLAALAQPEAGGER